MKQFDVIFLDIDMHILNGFKLDEKFIWKIILLK